MIVKDVMSRPIIIEKDINLSEAAKLMVEKRIGCLLFVKENELKGIVTERDLLRNFSKSKMFSDVMSGSLITVEPEASLEKALMIMKDNDIKRLPVVDYKEGKLVGIVTLTDLAKHMDDFGEDFFLN